MLTVHDVRHLLADLRGTLSALDGALLENAETLTPALLAYQRQHIEGMYGTAKALVEKVLQRAARGG